MYAHTLLYYDHYNTPEVLLKLTLTNYAVLRNYYWKSAPKDESRTYSPFILLASLLATATNSTLQSYPSFNGLSPLNRPFPSVLPQIQTNDVVNRRIPLLWKLYKNISSSFGKPIFLQVASSDVCFIYCQVPSQIQTDLLSYSEFTSIFDLVSWIVLLCFGIIITLLIGRSNWLYTVSAFISDGVHFRRSKVNNFQLLILWTLAASVVRQYYSGTITSTLIKPNEDSIFNTINDLEANNFSLSFDSPQSMNASISAYQSIGSYGLHKSVKSLQQLLLKRAVAFNSENEALNAFYDPNRNLAGVFQWTQGIKTIQKLNRISFAKSSKKRCYTGKTLIPLGQYYFGFLPPNNKRIACLFQCLFETGIFQLWYKESIQLSHSERVQDRVKVKGPTKLVNKAKNKIQSLQLQGKVLKIFVLFAIFLGICVLVCIAEVTLFKIKSVVSYLTLFSLLFMF